MTGTYLQHYQETLARELPGGLQGWLRSRLDRVARAQGHADRYGLFLPRALSLCGLPASPGSTVSVAELGPGSGWALGAQWDGLTRTAIDRTGEFAAGFAARGIAFHTADIERDPLPLATSSVDLMMMNHVIEHVADPRHLLSEIRRCLTPRGALYLRTPNIRKVGHAFWDDHTHVKPYTPDSLRGCLKVAGYRMLWSQPSDHGRINLDLLSSGRFRRLLFSRGVFEAGEIEAAFRPERPA